MQVCTSIRTDNHANTPPLSFFTGWIPFLPPNQQRQCTEVSRIGYIFKEFQKIFTLQAIQNKNAGDPVYLRTSYF